jgi:hypothetical protein
MDYPCVIQSIPSTWIILVSVDVQRNLGIARLRPPTSAYYPEIPHGEAKSRVCLKLVTKGGSMWIIVFYSKELLMFKSYARAVINYPSTRRG